MSVGATITQLESQHSQRVLLLVAVRTLWLGLLLALTLVAADAVFAFSDITRVYLDIAFFITLLLVMIGSYRRLSRSTSPERMVARMVESRNPGLGNSLVNAVEFEGRLSTSPEEESVEAGLMAMEVENATAGIVRAGNLSGLTPPTLGRERWACFGMIGAWVLSLIFLAGVLLAVLPRYIYPFGDFPPYSAIKFDVDPGRVEVDYGDNLKISVHTSGEIADNLTLVVADEKGTEIESVPMFNAGDGAFFQTVEDVKTPFKYFARVGRARTKRFAVSVMTQPRIEDAIVTYTYPEYTYMRPETRMLSDGIIRGYANTEVTLSIRSNRPLKSGELRVGDAQHAFIPDEEDHTVITRFTIAQDGAFVADIVDVEGFRNDGGLSGEIQIIPDERPEVTIVSPGMDSFAVPDSKIPIGIDAHDDLGITKVALYRNYNESADARKTLYEAEGREAYITVMETLDLADLGVRPGDVLDYYVTATDSHPGEPQTAATQSFRLQIISYEEYKEYMQTQMSAADLRQKYDTIREEMQALAEAQKEIRDEIESLENAEGGALSDEDRQRLEEARTAQAKLAQAASDLAERMKEEAERPAIFDIEESYKEILKELAEQIEQASQHMNNAATHLQESSKESASPGGTPMTLAQQEQTEALKKLGENLDTFDASIQESNENLEKVTGVIADVEMFKYLYSLQKGLERQIRFYKDIDNPSLEDQVRLKELSDQQEAVREALTQLQGSLREHADALDELATQQNVQPTEVLTP